VLGAVSTWSTSRASSSHRTLKPTTPKDGTRKTRTKAGKCGYHISICRNTCALSTHVHHSYARESHHARAPPRVETKTQRHHLSPNHAEQHLGIGPIRICVVRFQATTCGKAPTTPGPRSSFQAMGLEHEPSTRSDTRHLQTVTAVGACAGILFPGGVALVCVPLHTAFVRVTLLLLAFALSCAARFLRSIYMLCFR
jgi:hypothetical protein